MVPKDELLRDCLIWEEDEGEKVPWQDNTLDLGMAYQQISELTDIGKSYQWLEKFGVKDNTEALIITAQE